MTDALEPDRTGHNPLLACAERPDYSAIRPEHVSPAISELLAQAEAALKRAVGPEVAADYDAMAAVLETAVERLNAAWGHVSFLQSVADTPALRAAHAENLPRVVDFHTRLGADAGLYAKYKAIASGPGAAQLSPARRKALADALRDFVLGGAELQGAARERFAAVQDRMAALSQTFGDHVLDATDAFALVVPESRLAGVPADVVAAARERARAAGVEGCQLTLQIPCYLPVLQYAEDRALREAMFRAYSTRASELGAAEHDNSAIVRELVQLRQEEAALLGLPTYAHLSLVPKMARSPEEVLAFLRDLARRARPHADRELHELQAFAASHLGIADLQAWDRPFVAERLKQQRYAFSSAELKQYFTLPRVLQGLFRLVETLFGVALREDQAPVWHDSVRFYRVWRGSEPVAAFYLDLLARPGKGSGAWMSDARQRWRRPDGALQLPVAHLVCNFAAPVGDRPTLLTHDDVITLFHEFGHGLHHMLTQVDELAVAGIAGVEWDACELPSQFMENFCWEWEVLQRLTAHVDSGEPLPRELFDRLTAARHFQNGLRMVRHCEYALFDMRLHLEQGHAEAPVDALALARTVAAEVAPVAPPDFARYPHSFSHLFDGGYAAGYYGYAWAEVLSADAYSAFEEAGVFDAATGERFRCSILETGGSRPALESFQAFRGREPAIDALLRHQGLA
jgi:oligopeptidase A